MALEALRNISFYPNRERIAAELHTRTAPPLPAETRCSYLCFLTDEKGYEADLNEVRAICRAYAKPEPEDGCRHYVIDIDDLIIKWERHTELNSYSFYHHGYNKCPFEKTALEAMPQVLMDELKGQLFLAAHIEIYTQDRAEAMGQTLLENMLQLGDVMGGCVSDGKASIYSPMRLSPEGFHKFIIVHDHLHANRLGRLVQRLLEINQYQSAALLALSPARHALKSVNQMEEAMEDIVANLTEQLSNHDAARQMHHRISKLMADAENLSSDLAYRFSASSAYYQLVLRRLSELQETKVPGHLRLTSFIQKRLEPAMATCTSVEDRLQKLTRRISRAASILRTHIDLTLEQQNQDLLKSMNERAKTQLRLQETVESLSVVAISYYFLGIIKYMLEGSPELPWGITPKFALTAIAPLVLLATWAFLRRVRKKILHHDP